MSSRNILITAAGGNIGSALIPQLLSEEHMKLVLPTSNATRLQSKLPSNASTSSNIAVEEGKIQDPNWVESILTKHNIDTVFLCLTGTDELMTSLNFFDAMQRAGTVEQLIYLSANGTDFASEQGVKRLMQIASAAHVVVKGTLEQKLAYAGFPWKTTVLGPTLFMSNDLRSKQSMLQRGYFDEPLGSKGVSRVSTDDIALAIHNAILSPAQWAGQKIMIGSRKIYTGAEVTALWTEALGREIRIAGSDKQSLDAFERDFAEKTGMGPEWGRDLRLMYEIFEREAFGMSEEEYSVQARLLGREPVDYEGWVREVGGSWR